jgi:hypothetical protein
LVTLVLIPKAHDTTTRTETERQTTMDPKLLAHFIVDLVAFVAFLVGIGGIAFILLLI